MPPTATATPVPERSSPTPTATDLPSALDIGATPTPVSVLYIPPDAEALILRALADLESQQGIARGDIHLLSVDAFIWPDTALGCAARAVEGETASAQVPGYRILLSADDRIVVYHTDRDETIFVCDDPGWLAQEGEPLPIDPVADTMAELVARDVAQRLGVPDAQIALVSLLAVDWPDTSLGCPRPTGAYDPVETPGYRLVLRSGSQALIYHTSIRDFVLCAPEGEILPDILRDALPAPAPDATAESG